MTTGPPGEAGHHKIRRDADNQYREGAHGQEDEARKNENVNRSSGFITRMLPLPQPKFRDSSQPRPWLVEAQITLSAKQRRQALGHNVGETQDAQHMND